MLRKFLNLYLSPDGDEGGGGGGQANGDGGDDQHARLAGEGGDDDEGNGDEGDGGEGGEGGDGKPATGLTKDDITDILSRVMPAGGSAEREARQPERQLTQEEIERTLNVWKPDVSFLRKLGFAEPTAEQLAAVHEMRDHLVRQANTMSEARFQQALSEFKGQLNELSGYVSEQRAAADERAFFSKYKELEPYSEIVEAVSRKLEDSGFKAHSKDKVFEEIAKNTTEVLKRMNIKVEKKTGAGSGTAGKGNGRMAALAGGGQAGGGGGGDKAAKKRPGMEIFSED